MAEICVVDDEAGIVDMVRDYLADSFSIRAFTSPDQAIEAFDRDYRPDLLVADIKMPKTDGFDLVQIARSRSPGLPVVMISGFAEKHHVLSALENQIFGFIEKPFNPDKLRQVIRSLLEKSDQIRRLEFILNQFDILVCASLNLNRNFVSRFAAAENRLYECGLSLHKDKEAVQDYLKQIREQNDLERVINNSSREIRDLLQKHAELVSKTESFARRLAGRVGSQFESL